MAMTYANAEPLVDIKTTMGDIKVKLYDDTPAHRDNFLKLVRRVITMECCFIVS